ncbi:MAG: OB-fold domain-containing protein [Acidimicrobiales bacterium]|nr:OB-fold domain-containing protein [Acidimicrobiales bacterium]
MNRVPFAPGVFTWPAEEPQLIGGRCGSCAAVAFPVAPSCPRCGATEIAEHRLPRRGRLWTWTTQSFLPKEPYAGGETPETFRPYGVGVVELGDEVRVEGRLTVADPEQLEIGMEMEVVAVPFRTDGGVDGEVDSEVMVFAFAPIASGKSDSREGV